VTYPTFGSARLILIRAGYEPIPGGGYGNGEKLASITFVGEAYQINYLKDGKNGTGT
jgi:hypothetical protein